MPFVTLGTPAHAATTGQTAADHHTATAASDLNLADLAERDHASLQNLDANDHLVNSSQADFESESASARALVPGGVRFAPGTAKCWVNFNQDTPAIVASYNIASVTDTSAGVHTVVVDDDFSADTFAVVNGFNDSANSANLGNEVTALAVGSFANETRAGNTLTDWDKNMYACFGDQ